MLKKYWTVLFIVFGSIPLLEYLTYDLTRPNFVTIEIVQLINIYLRVGPLAVILFGAIFLNNYSSITKVNKLLLLAIFSLYLPMLISSFIGFQPSFNVELIELFLMFTFLPLIRKPYCNELYKYIIVIGRFYLITAILLFLLSPSLVTQTEYDQSYLGISLRLNGLTNHANTLGLILSIYIVFEFINGKKGFLRSFLLFFGFLALFLTQSKTAWIIMIIALFYIVIRTIRYLKVKQAWLALSVMILFTVFISLILLVSGSITSVEAFINHNQLLGLTGRDVVWAFTKKYADLNVIFGYGPELWSTTMKAAFESNYGWTPSHAHSQYYQTLGNAGYLGVLGLLIYIVILIYLALKFNVSTRGLSIVVVVLLLMRGISEPIFMISLTNISLFLNFVVVIFFSTIELKTISSKNY